MSMLLVSFSKLFWQGESHWSMIPRLQMSMLMVGYVALREPQVKTCWCLLLHWGSGACTVAVDEHAAH